VRFSLLCNYGVLAIEFIFGLTVLIVRGLFDRIEVVFTGFECSSGSLVVTPFEGAFLDVLLAVVPRTTSVGG